MSTARFGPNFPKVFAAALLQEVSFVLMVHFPGYLEGLGITESLIGVLYASAAVVALGFRPALGRILDLTHRRTVLLVTGLINASVVLALAATVAWGPLLWGLFLVQRVMQIALFTTMLTYGADSLPIEHRTQGLALFGLSGLFPIALGGVAGDLVIESFGFGALFVLASAASVSAWLLVWRLPLLPILGRQPRRGFWAALAQRNLLPLWWITLFFSIGLETLFTFTRTYVADRGVGSTGLFFGVYGLAAAAMRILGGRYYDRIPQRPLVVGALVAYGLGLALLAVAGSVPVLVGAAVAGGAAHGVVFPILASQVVNRARIAERGSAMSIFTSIFDIALLMAAPVVGVLIDGFSYRLAFGVVSLALGGGAVVYALWDRRLVAADVAAAA
ncbi:MAG TPA: MFS transporter [Acidimicrobiia bacterium]|nr:MFS transporter [Acidimicrobiia bacterium]